MTSLTWTGRAVVAALLAVTSPSIGETQTTAIVGATVIDGTGGAPVRDATIVVQGNRIAAFGPRASVKVPSDARVVDATNKYVTPGFIDVNVHVTGQGFMKELYPLVVYGEKDPFLKYGYALEAAQMSLKFGVTTIRDTFGPLPTLLALRDAIAHGELVGPRLQVAGDILGWSGGMYCAPDAAPPIDRQWCDYFRGHLPVGVELTLLYPDSVRKVINRYLDLGVDFIKFGETTEGPCCPSYIVFSPRVQRAIVEEAHKRGIKVDVHSSNAEGHLLAAEAGVDLITHTGLLSQELSDEVVQVLRDRGVICGLFTSWSTGPMRKWLEAQASPPAAGDSAMVAELRRQVWPNRQRRQSAPLSGVFGGQSTFPLNVKTWRYNDAKLIRGKCTIAVGTDAAPTPWPEITGTGPNVPGFINPDRPFYADPGIGTILAIEGLVELGMTPGEAIVAATAHGAMATGKSAELGTIAVGKLADLLILGADPLANISNIRKLDLIFKDGHAITPDSLPTRPVYYRR